MCYSTNCIFIKRINSIKFKLFENVIKINLKKEKILMNTGEFSKRFNKIQPIIGCVIIVLMALFAYKLHTPKLIFGLNYYTWR